MRDGAGPLLRGEEENRWLLPEGIEEVLPPEAWALERLSRAVLDLYRGWGYALVIPPLLEYLESLLAGTGQDMALRTFKVTDQISGRMMGLRADITPQVARIDAHVLQDAAPTRLCYLGTVLHSRADSIHAARSPLQAGAELYGHLGLDSDLEVLLLMLETLRAAGLAQEGLCVDIGHMGLYRALVQALRVDAGQEPVLFSLLQRKAAGELQQALSGWQVPEPLARALCQVTACCSGARQLLEQARAVLLPVLEEPAAGDADACLRDLEQLDERLTASCDAPVTVRYDLCELRGYRYHTGVNFAAYCAGYGAALAVGGRYDGIGKAFGRARPATGFSTDLRNLLRVAQAAPGARDEQRRLIFAPAADDPDLRAAVRSLREQGEAVLVDLSGQAQGAAAMGCSHVLERRAGQWRLRALDAG